MKFVLIVAIPLSLLGLAACNETEASKQERDGYETGIETPADNSLAPAQGSETKPAEEAPIKAE